ncbi:hypothetical protein Hesp01_27110 [Herbidospora sp. NBRC 101105]|nr:hypothetical protein Hesp01_27110 [Herbidospora sp. NBRC 101105]
MRDPWPELTGTWRTNRPECLPVAHELKWACHSRWVRFHSLPESKRYPDTADEYTILLNRYETVLSELFGDRDVYVITTAFTDHPTFGEPLRYPEPVTLNPGARLWMTVTDDAPDEEFPSYSHLLVTRRTRRPGSLDALLRAVADDAMGNVMITDLDMRRVFHPYDGGADCILEDSATRDDLKAAHREWLSDHPQGL